jgi:hypothetical protein
MTLSYPPESRQRVRASSVAVAHPPSSHIARTNNARAKLQKRTVLSAHHDPIHDCPQHVVGVMSHGCVHGASLAGLLAARGTVKIAIAGQPWTSFRCI